MADIKGRLRQVLVESLDLRREPDTIPDTNLVAELGLDSINTIEFLIWVESEFGIEIADEDLSVDLIDDLSRLAAYVEQRSQQTVAN
ncbi:acyl carrier protein [Actinosynnema sp. ALI-1.44]|uniref:acyl carrier protein n=1 Tax=Actinosynnema sp. ALI-1.44 TaxID=1933779 RepID=UPI00143CF053|nr:phosphopantetheine-binding protein [Actinosynnema sp. ALI-1.44]